MNGYSSRKDFFYIIILILTFITVIVGAAFALYSFIFSQPEGTSAVYTGTLSIEYLSGDIINCGFLYPVDNPTIDSEDNVYKNNFRVKNSEKIETLFDISMEQFEQEKLSTLIYDQVLNSQLIKKEDRVTSMDMWVSYLAFIFDLNYQSSFRYLLETNYLEENIDRISYKNKDTYKKMQLIKSHGYRYIRYHASLNTKI